MNTPDEILRHYPDIPDLILWLKMPETQEAIEYAGRIGTSPKRMIEVLKLATARRILINHPTLGSMTEQQAALYARILEQIDHPQTLRYVTGKLGAV